MGMDANNYCPVTRDEILSLSKSVDPVPDSDRERRLMERGEQTLDERAWTRSRLEIVG